MNSKGIGYWATTGLVAFAVVSGGAAELARRPDNIEGLVKLGYPAYLATIIGFWKVLGTIAILVPRLPRLKEWAYAGIFFNMTGAAASHVFSANYGAYAYHIIATVFLAVLAVISWALRPQSRTLGVLFAAKPRLSD